MAFNEVTSIALTPAELSSLRPTTFYSIDGDHAAWNQGSITENGVFQIERYSETTQNIFRDLVNKTLEGDIVLLNTGKGVNFISLIPYLEKAVYEEAQKRGMVTGHPQTDEKGESFTVYSINDGYRDPCTGRLLTRDKKRPVMMFFSMENGAHWYDVMDPEKRVFQHKLPIETWETLADPHIAQLIQDSTNEKRIETLARVTPRFKKPTDYRPVYEMSVYSMIPESKRLTLYQDRIGHLACVSPWNTKTNLVIDIVKVINRPDLMRQWGDLAGTPILQPEEKTLELKEQKRIAGERVLQALRRLLPINNIFHSFANGTHFYDIAPGGIDKASVTREIQNYVARVYRDMGLSHMIPDFSRSISIGDGNPVDSNDAPMYRATEKAFSNKRHNGLPYIGDVLSQDPGYHDDEADEIEKVRLFLRFAQEHPEMIPQYSR
jgi:hypothetical protein